MRWFPFGNIIILTSFRVHNTFHLGDIKRRHGQFFTLNKILAGEMKITNISEVGNSTQNEKIKSLSSFKLIVVFLMKYIHKIHFI